MTESGRGDSASVLEEQLRVSIDYAIELPPFSADFFRELCGLCGAVFKEPVNDLRWRLENMPYQTVVCARASGRVVGFKAGYAMSQSRYYSWLGGVQPDSQRQGIASHLMELQHELVRKRGFEFIETATDEGNVALSRANLATVTLSTRVGTDRPHSLQIRLSRAGFRREPEVARQRGRPALLHVEAVHHSAPARALGGIHGVVGQSQQWHGLRRVVRCERVADAG